MNWWEAHGYYLWWDGETPTVGWHDGAPWEYQHFIDATQPLDRTTTRTAVLPPGWMPDDCPSARA